MLRALPQTPTKPGSERVFIANKALRFAESRNVVASADDEEGNDGAEEGIAGGGARSKEGRASELGACGGTAGGIVRETVSIGLEGGIEGDDEGGKAELP